MSDKKSQDDIVFEIPEDLELTTNSKAIVGEDISHELSKNNNANKKNETNSKNSDDFILKVNTSVDNFNIKEKSGSFKQSLNNFSQDDFKILNSKEIKKPEKKGSLFFKKNTKACESSINFSNIIDSKENKEPTKKNHPPIILFIFIFISIILSSLTFYIEFNKKQKKEFTDNHEAKIFDNNNEINNLKQKIAALEKDISSIKINASKPQIIRTPQQVIPIKKSYIQPKRYNTDKRNFSRNFMNKKVNPKIYKKSIYNQKN